ncbi:MAG: PIN domain-containing protein [Planctomycetaceae bacterium]|nr:PIN domain-containing protein [Planctomycetaceae bacterium]
MRLYLDACCLNRPFDDQSQLRVRLEAEAIRTIFQLCTEGLHQWIGSAVLLMELGRTPDEQRRQRTTDLLELADVLAESDPADRARARELALLGFGDFDAAHLATAERLACDVFLTTDDRLIKKAHSLAPALLRIRAMNPLSWLQEIDV